MSELPAGRSAASQERPRDLAPRVAVITVTYNRARLLAKAIDSVLSQGYQNLRLIVVDDGSTDDTGVLLSRYGDDPRVEVVRHETNRGMRAARNTALAQLNDEDVYFCYLDSDDKLTPGAIQTMVDAFMEHGDRYSMVWAASQVEQTGESDGWHSLKTDEITLDDYMALRVRGDFMQLVRRDLAAGVRMPEEARQADGTMWAQVLRSKPALMIPDVVQLTDRSGADRRSHVTYTRDYAESMMWSRLFALKVYGAELRQAYPLRYAALLRELGQFAAMAGDTRRAGVATRSALRLDPSPRTVFAACATLAPSWLVLRGARILHWIRSL
jgi:glycosyltransferase involved in cell wall biosynthesis